MAAPPPPPRRTVASPAVSSPAEPQAEGWKAKMKAKGSVWGKKAMDKGVVLSDNIGNRVNNIAEKRFGTEHFWPVTGDFVREMDKCARILRSFTVDGVVKEETVTDGQTKKKQKVLRKIPPEVIREAKGVAIFTAMRSGFAPLGGAGGAGLVMAKLPDGSWSAPSSITPNNLSGGLLIGLDVYDCVLIIRSQKALNSFGTHKVTLGAEIGVAAGPWGAGAAVESGTEKAPVFSYVNSKGLYAGVEIVGQVFVERYEENGAMYHWPGVKAADILSGKVKVPIEAAALHAALRDAETGKAQAEKGSAFGTILDSANTSQADLQLAEGEVLKLPPTPDQTDGTELSSVDTSRVGDAIGPNTGLGGSRLAPPPMHPSRTSTPGPSPLLPPRNGQSCRQHSSVSHYSNDEEVREVPPPAYHPGSEILDANVDSGRVRPPGWETMSDTERREWEEHWKAEQEADEQLNRAMENRQLAGGTETTAASTRV